MEHLDQLGFEELLASADNENRDRKFERQTAHLPGSMDEALPFYRALMERHHVAMMAANTDEVMRLREEARRLAVKLNGGEHGILAHEDAPGRVLDRATAACPGVVPFWGQSGAFVVAVDAMKVRIELEGIFGICSGYFYWPGFSAHAVEPDEPFLSQTGYRSFLGIHADERPDLTPADFVRKVIGHYVETALSGNLVAITEPNQNPEMTS